MMCPTCKQQMTESKFTVLYDGKSADFDSAACLEKWARSRRWASFFGTGR